ncbi:MAG: histone family protein [Candidatus Aenigmatarchaeota archaeon]|nr:MAG: histone family protein [Candidatus Aenigmarchaeota archaeon]
MTLLPLAPLKRIAKKAGAKRISDKAVEELREYVEEVADAMAKDASVAAKHAGRVTVKEDDIKLVAKR